MNRLKLDLTVRTLFILFVAVCTVACQHRKRIIERPPCTWLTEWHTQGGRVLDNPFAVLHPYIHLGSTRVKFGESLDLRPIDTLNGMMKGNNLQIDVSVSDALCEDFRDRPISYSSYIGHSDSTLFQDFGVDPNFVIVRLRERFKGSYSVYIGFHQADGVSPGLGLRLIISNNVIVGAGASGIRIS